MTGLIPAVARQMGIPCLFTIHNIHTVKSTLSEIENKGIDAQAFWQHLYFEHIPDGYWNSRHDNPIDFLLSGIFAAHFVNTVSPNFLKEIIDGRHAFIDEKLKQELSNKYYAGCAFGILNSPDPGFNPGTDKRLAFNYGPPDHAAAKKKNKVVLQKMLALVEDENAPVFFWPSRLDPIQKGCRLLADILYTVISKFWEDTLQIIFVANGDFQSIFWDILNFHKFYDRVAICDFDENLEHLAYGASDFILMPSRFEPCGLPQMIAPIYGALPVAYDTGGIHDTISHMDWENNAGNGFLFETHDAGGLLWAMEQAMGFFKLPPHVKEAQIERVMIESASVFNHSVTARQYIDLYEKMLKRPLVSTPESGA